MSEASRSRLFGWASLFGWALVGFALELAHGFKLSAYLDDELTRLLLTLAHAHGVGLSLVVLAHAAIGAELAPGRPLRFAAVTLPAGFLAGAVAHPESDPSLGILLVPVGALALLFGLGRLAVAAYRQRAEDR